MIQIPANSNDATTDHKLQGMSKDVIIVASWTTGGMVQAWVTHFVTPLKRSYDEYD
jgi:hypothetical protein